MPINDQIMKGLLNQKALLEKTIQESRSELSQLNMAIDALMGNTVKYKWSERIVELLERERKFLQTVQIQEKLVDAVDLQDEDKRRKTLVGISVALNNICGTGVLSKIVVGGVKGHFYGLADWISKTGHLKKEYVTNIKGRYGILSDPITLKVKDMSSFLDKSIP